jgi:hypothetical protein
MRGLEEKRKGVTRQEIEFTRKVLSEQRAAKKAAEQPEPE